MEKPLLSYSPLAMYNKYPEKNKISYDPDSFSWSVIALLIGTLFGLIIDDVFAQERTIVTIERCYSERSVLPLTYLKEIQLENCKGRAFLIEETIDEKNHRVQQLYLDSAVLDPDTYQSVTHTNL